MAGTELRGKTVLLYLVKRLAPALSAPLGRMIARYAMGNR